MVVGIVVCSSAVARIGLWRVQGDLPCCMRVADIFCGHVALKAINPMTCR
jgi:hypothetical protein